MGPCFTGKERQTLYAYTVESIICDVIRLRCQGLKRARDTVRSAAPVRGRLVMFLRPEGGRPRIPVAALMPPDRHDYLIPPLDQARILRWHGRQMVIAGIEEERIRRSSVEYPQAWWIRLIELCDSGAEKTLSS